MAKKFKILIAVGAVVFVLAGLWFIIPSKPSDETEDQVATPQPPALFAEDEYVITEQTDGALITIPKLGFQAKAPLGWKINKEKINNLEREDHWIDMYSPDATDLTQKSFLEQGCGISISAGIERENVEQTQKEITDIQNQTQENLQSNYQYDLITMGPYQAIYWLSSEKPHLGQFAGIDIPIDNLQIIHLNVVFPPNYKEKCEPIWQAFIQSISFQ